MIVGEMIVIGLGVWFGLGGVIALIFLSFGVSRIDEAAKGASFLFRSMIFLGCTILWPVVLFRWFSGDKINEQNEES